MTIRRPKQRPQVKRSKSSLVKRYLKQKTSSTLSTGKKALKQLATVKELKDEIGLLTTYSTDVIYRLRYGTMAYDYISPSIERLLGYAPAEMKHIPIRSLILETRIVTDAMKTVESFDALESSRKKGEVNKWQADYRMRCKDGSEIWVSDISYPWYNDKGAIIGSVGSLRDITDRVEAESQVKGQMQRLANSDMLTGLSNRRAFFTRLEEELKRIKRSRDDLAVLIIDIDHFKKINTAHGNKVGDTVIQGVAKIVQSCLRETDTGARIGGEEFGVILPETNASGAYWVAERIRASVAKEHFNDGNPKHVIGCTVSIGVASARFDENVDAGTLYKYADTRLFIAKHTGRNQVSMDELVEAVH